MYDIEHAKNTFANKAKTFSLASRVFSSQLMQDTAVVYSFCRLVDDIVDESTNMGEAMQDLENLRLELRGAREARPLIESFLHVAQKYHMPIEYPLELIDGVAKDSQVVRVRDESELVRYCYGVASTVGLMMCSVLGARHREALPFAVDLGVAMQMTNICRDVKEDALNDRIYVPQEWLSVQDFTPAQILNADSNSKLRMAVKKTLHLADRYYQSSEKGLCFLPLRARFGVFLASRLYRQIGVKLLGNGGDPTSGRTVLSKFEKTTLALRFFCEFLFRGCFSLSSKKAHEKELHTHLKGLSGANS